MPFSNPVMGGKNIVRTVMQSPNFVPGVSGWAIYEDGSAEFQDIILPSGEGIRATFSATAPGSPKVGDLWYDTANGLQVSQWNGSAWVAYSIGSGAIASGGIATGNIASGAITNALLAASAVATSNIQNGAVSAAQINAAAGILGTQLASGTITNTELAGSVTARSLGGITTTIAGSAPGSPVAGDIWIDSASGYQIQQYSGSGWVPVTWTATDVIAAGTITAALITANTITASQIAAGTITAAQIAAGTITASLLAAGIVVAGIVDATTINAATFTGSVFEGTDFILNSSGAYFYSGTPASGNLIASVTRANGTDGFGNTVWGGITTYTSAGQVAQLFNGQLLTFASGVGSGSGTQGSQYSGVTTLGGNTGGASLFFGGAESTNTEAEMVLADSVAGGGTPAAWFPGTQIVTPEAIHAVNPSTGAIETWHSLTAGNSWTGTVYYRLTSENEVYLWSNNLSAPSSAANGVTIVTLPTGYRPAVSMTFMIGAQANASQWPRLTLATTGTIQATGVLASTGVTLGTRIPLDLP